MAFVACVAMLPLFSATFAQPAASSEAELASITGAPAPTADSSVVGPRSATLRKAHFGGHRPTSQLRSVADWVAHSGDNRGAPFLIVDKRIAKVFVFDADARVVAASPVLLGLARGDVSAAGIGERKLNDIKPSERTTPAGAFDAEGGSNLHGEPIVWIDYDAAVSMHRVRANNPVERRLERLASPTVSDNRISYGCINVPAAFFDAHVSPIFDRGRRARVYVLPETRPLQDVFPLSEDPGSAATRM